jgi:hypothetical protein
MHPLSNQHSAAKNMNVGRKKHTGLSSRTSARRPEPSRKSEKKKNTRVKVTYSTNNSLGKLLAKKHYPLKNKYENSGIYQLTCPTCSMKYMGQTDGCFRIRFQEHLRDFRYGNGKSSFALHLLENGHNTGFMEDIMNTIHITGKGRLMDTLEKSYIFRETKLNNQINDKLAVKPNIIFDTRVQKDPHRGIHNVCHTG